MKKISVITIIAIAALFQACEKDEYHYLDKSTLFYYNVGDTLIYQSPHTEDSFCVYSFFYYFRQQDHYHSQCTYLLIDRISNSYSIQPEGEKNIADDSMIYIGRQGYYTEVAVAWNRFNESASKLTDSTITYIIGNHQISNVFKLVSKDDSNLVVYYNYNYGIIAYNFGELFELKEQYLR